MNLGYPARSFLIRSSRKLGHFLRINKNPYKIKSLEEAKNIPQNKIKIIKFFMRKKIYLKKTKTKHPFLPLIQRKSVLFCQKKTWLAEIKNALVFGPDIALACRDGTLISDVSLAWEDKANNYPVFRNIIFGSPKKIKQKAVLLAVTGGNSFFHWLFEVLPKLKILEDANQKDINLLYILNGTHQNFQKETLSLLGIKLEKVINLEESPTLFLENVLIPSYPCHYGTPSKAEILYLQRKLKSPFYKSLLKKKGRKRLFIKRRNGGRQLLYEDAIEQALQPFGFRAVEPEKLPLHQQIALFDQAEVVIAPHGAGLANIIFCRPGTKILEIFSGDYVNLCYQHLAGNCGLNHFAVHPWSKKDGLLALNSADRGLNRKDIPILPEDILPVLAQAKVNRK